MIKDKLYNFRHFIKIRAAFEQAFEFLSRKDPADIPDGTYAVNGEKLFVLMSHSKGKGITNAKLEAHRKYIDIQYLISGMELIGVKKTSECTNKLAAYDPQKDIIFFADKPEKYLKLKPGEFVIFFPEDAHAPLAGKSAVHKAVVKARVE